MIEKTTKVAVLGQNDIPKMLSQVEEQIKLIKGNLPSTPKTDKDLPSFGKIDDIKTLDNIIKAGSMVRGKANLYKKVAKELVPEGIKIPEFNLHGMTEKAMMDHLKVRAAEVGNEEKLGKLKKIKKELESNLSAEAKLAKSLQTIHTILDE